MPKYVVVYQTGDKDNFKWKRVKATFSTKEAAREVRKQILRDGYVAYQYQLAIYEKFGLPTTYADPKLLKPEHFAMRWVVD